MKYLVLLMVVLAVSACEEKKVGGYTEKELSSIRVNMDFDAIDKAAAEAYKKDSQNSKKSSSGAAETSPQK
jgi:hypothetical protein